MSKQFDRIIFLNKKRREEKRGVFMTLKKMQTDWSAPFLSPKDGQPGDYDLHWAEPILNISVIDESAFRTLCKSSLVSCNANDEP